MLNSLLIERCRRMLEGKPILLAFDSKGKNRFFAEVIYFLMLACLAIGFTVWRLILRPNEPEQFVWDVFLAAVLVLWSLFVLVRTIYFRPVDINAIVIHQDGIRSVRPDGKNIAWDRLASAFVLPWCIVFRSRTGETLCIGPFTRGYEELKRLAVLMVTPMQKPALSERGLETELAELFQSLRETH
jgi:hypothetical protein